MPAQLLPQVPQTTAPPTKPAMHRKQSSPMMPPFMVSAPGKVIVYGEHAVVHGKVSNTNQQATMQAMLTLAASLPSPPPFLSARTSMSRSSPSRTEPSPSASPTSNLNTHGTSTIYPGMPLMRPARRSTTMISSHRWIPNSWKRCNLTSMQSPPRSPNRYARYTTPLRAPSSTYSFLSRRGRCHHACTRSDPQFRCEPVSAAVPVSQCASAPPSFSRSVPSADHIKISRRKNPSFRSSE